MGTAEIRTFRQAPAIVQMCGQNLELEVDQRFHQAGLDVAALASDAAPDKTGENALHDCRARQHIAHRQSKRHRPLALVAVQPHQSGTGLRQKILTRALNPGPFIAIAGDRWHRRDAG